MTSQTNLPTGTKAPAKFLDSKTLRWYDLVPVASETGSLLNARTGTRYDLVRRYV